MLGIVCDGSKYVEYDGIIWTNYKNGYYSQKKYGQLYHYIFKKYVGPIPKGYDIHHANENPLDNRVMNLWLMTHRDHTRLHALGRKLSFEAKKKISIANKGKKFSDEHKAKIGAASRNRSAETKAKMSAAKQNISVETRAKISAIHKGKIVSDDTRAKMSVAKKGRVFSDESKVKMSESAKLRWLKKTGEIKW